MIQFFESISASTYISILSLALSSFLAIDKWLAYRTRTEINQIEYATTFKNAFYVHFFITNKSSRVLGIYDIEIDPFTLSKSSHLVSTETKIYPKVMTTAFPINIQPWEQRSILVEFVYRGKNDNVNFDGNFSMKIKTNRQNINVSTDTSKSKIEIEQAVKEW